MQCLLPRPRRLITGRVWVRRRRARRRDNNRLDTGKIDSTRRATFTRLRRVAKACQSQFHNCRAGRRSARSVRVQHASFRVRSSPEASCDFAIAVRMLSSSATSVTTGSSRGPKLAAFGRKVVGRPPVPNSSWPWTRGPTSFVSAGDDQRSALQMTRRAISDVVPPTSTKVGEVSCQLSSA